MQQSTFSAQKFTTSPIGLGCSLMSGQYGPRDDARSAKVLAKAVELGIRYFDTSDAYGNGHNEELLGKTLAAMASDISIGTKFGNIRGPGGKRGGTNGHPDYVPQACDLSLKRLGRDAIDLYLLHRIDPDVPIEDTVGAMGRLVDQGKVRHIGICEASSATIARAHATYPLTMVQTEYSLWTRDVEADILPTCRRLGIALTAYAPLGRGFLTAAITKDEDLKDGDRRRDHPRFAPENVAQNVKLLSPLNELSERHGCHSSQIALAWLLSRGGDILPIPGTMNPDHLASNVAALDLKLSDQEIELLETVFVAGAAAGTRYPESQMHQMNAESRPR